MSISLQSEAFLLPIKNIFSCTQHYANNLPGVEAFDQWFSSTQTKSNYTMKNVKHSLLSNGRGLEFVGQVEDIKEKPVIRISKDVVLQSMMMNDNTGVDNLEYEWDVDLALQLLREWKKGEASKIYGYCSLLTRGQKYKSGDSTCPPWTAPDCIRHWTNDQRTVLAKSPRGKKLIRVAEKQEREWINKYESIPATDKNNFSEEQFIWALEAVNSRAFKGDFAGENVFKNLSKSIVPFAAAAFALNYIRQDPFNGTDENFTVALLVLSCAPVALNFISENFGSKSMDAVLLPFIDSANHMERSDSIIEFDPLNGEFAVTVQGYNGIIKEKDGRNQFYISYGPKKDTELLLNYGFLSEFNLNDASMSDDDRRKLLSEEFNARSM